MALRLGDVFPNFSADTTEGHIDKFHDWIGDSWAVFFSHPADFTPVCTTELSRAAQLSPEFRKRNVKLIALSCDSVESHKGWIEDLKSYAKWSGDWPFPIVADEQRNLANLLGMLDPEEKDSGGMPLTCRAVFVIGPDKRLKLSILYPATTGRNFEPAAPVWCCQQWRKRKFPNCFPVGSVGCHSHPAEIICVSPQTESAFPTCWTTLNLI